MTRQEWIGWWLFTASACAFVVSGILSGDVPTLVGSGLFLVACLVFMAPRGQDVDAPTKTSDASQM